jgi:hypothetical protein
MTDPTLAERLARCVRKLEWTALSIDRGDGHSEPSGDYEAECFFDTYQIQAPDSRGCYTLSADHFSHPHDTLEAAQAAAQADCTARSLAIWDLDALAREVEAMVRAETERCIAAFEDHFPGRLYASNRTKAIAAIRAREGGKP